MSKEELGKENLIKEESKSGRHSREKVNKKKSSIKKQSIDNSKEKMPKKKRHIFRNILILILMLIIIAISYIGFKTVKNGGGLQGLLATLLGHNEQTVLSLNEIKILLLGESGNLTDTIMVVSYDPKVQKASLLSIPRDSFIGDDPEKATAFDKLNSVCQGKYPEKTLKEVCELLRIDIPYYMLVDTKALRELVDAIGGVEFNVPMDMHYEDDTQALYIDLQEGVQILDGDKAEQLLRFRHNDDYSSYPTEYGDNDYGRMRTQREFIMAVIKQTVKPDNILKIRDIIDITYENLTTNLTISDIKDYLPYAVNFNVDNLNTGVLKGVPKKYNKLSFIAHDDEEINEVVGELFVNSIEDINLSMINVEIINASGDKEQLSKTKEALEKAGYNVKKSSTSKKTQEDTTIINRSSLFEVVTDDILKIIKTGEISKGGKTSNIDITITLGTNSIKEDEIDKDNNNIE